MRDITPGIQNALRCPRCQAQIRLGADEARCAGDTCGAAFPVVDGIPVLLNEARSLFRLDDYRKPLPEPQPQGVRAAGLWVAGRLPRLAMNVHGEQNVRLFADLVEARSPRPCVLIIGGRTPGVGTESVLDRRRIHLVEIDIAFGPRTAIVCDAHDLPFADNTFDGIIAQAVIEYLIRPQRAVDEMHRVLKPRGVVYAETPFMQQVHGGPYDFARFSPVGHRTLFRRFDEILSGVACGPGMALAGAYRHFLMSCATSRPGRWIANAFARVTSAWLPYIDTWIVDHPASLDAASGSFFLGRRAERELTDRELIQSYRGRIRI